MIKKQLLLSHVHLFLSSPTRHHDWHETGDDAGVFIAPSQYTEELIKYFSIKGSKSLPGWF